MINMVSPSRNVPIKSAKYPNSLKYTSIRISFPYPDAVVAVKSNFVHYYTDWRRIARKDSKRGISKAPAEGPWKRKDLVYPKEF